MSQTIFEYLHKFGFAAIARSEAKVTQLVKHFAEVPDSKIPNNLIGMLKEDGISCLMVVYKKQAEFFTRTGKKMTNTAQLKNNVYMQTTVIPDGVYAGELCTYANASLEELGGTTNPNRVEALSVSDLKEPLANTTRVQIAELLHLRVFDYVTIAQFIAGKTVGFNRLSRVKFIKDHLGHSQFLSRIQPEWVAKTHLDDYAEELIQKGAEGAVFSNPNAEWVAGHKGFHQMKLVRGIHLDLTCMGVVWGEDGGKYADLIGALKFEYKGLPFNAGLGKGWDVPRQLYETLAYKKDPTEIVGKLWHVYGLQVSSKGVIRLPKVAEKRIDKTISD